MHSNLHSIAVSIIKLWFLYTEKLFPLHLTKWSKYKCRASGNTSGQHKRALWKGHGLRYGATGATDATDATVLRCSFCPPKNGHHWDLHAFYELEKDEKNGSPSRPAVERVQRKCGMSHKMWKVKGKKYASCSVMQKKKTTQKNKWKMGWAPRGSYMLSLFALRLGHIETNVGPGGDSVWAHLVT